MHRRRARSQPRVRAGTAVLPVVGVLAAVAVLAACSSPAATLGPSPSPEPTLAPTAVPTAAPTAVAEIVGNWTRLNTCDEALAAFKAAGLEDQIPVWVVGNFLGEDATPAPGHECDGAHPAEKHSHFFTGAGRFGSRNANGSQVDDGDYVLVDVDTLSFPSHASEFGYEGELLVDVSIDGETATFSLEVPAGCEGSCRIAYGWALSAFFGPTPWTRTA